MTHVAASRTMAAAARRAAVFKALGEPTRLRIVEFLRRRRGWATGTEVAEDAGISLALLCHHTEALVEAGVVRKRKQGQTSFWRLNRRLLAAVSRRLAE